MAGLTWPAWCGLQDVGWAAGCVPRAALSPPLREPLRMNTMQLHRHADTVLLVGGEGARAGGVGGYSNTECAATPVQGRCAELAVHAGDLVVREVEHTELLQVAQVLDCRNSVGVQVQHVEEQELPEAFDLFDVVFAQHQDLWYPLHVRVGV